MSLPLSLSSLHNTSFLLTSYSSNNLLSLRSNLVIPSNNSPLTRDDVGLKFAHVIAKTYRKILLVLFSRILKYFDKERTLI